MHLSAESGMFHPSRMGLFRVSYDMISDRPSLVARVFRDTIVLRAEALYVSKEIEYQLMCGAFDLAATGELLPEYDAIYDENTDTVTWKKHGCENQKDE